ncbi:PLC-like phosphodiesterase [Pholiota conissans]|uniref:PLC-like phosphodiesterase n=1 Tax=Pholiota conissans TaxID=109636 RepID=A0A9P6CZJ5_9AGAR|nr:PLC-like phosphodiesterase [Pholiota conissans]
MATSPTSSSSMSSITRTLPDCWGHRGASSRFPENTLASFEAAMRDGAEGIESDVHVSADGVVVMFHDPVLDRVTDSTGRIKDQNWNGENGLQHVRTKKEPKQAIPTFAQAIELLMRPENLHVKFNIDVKADNDPTRLFTLLHETISAQPDYLTLLAPRIVLGLWHPRFLTPAKTLLPYCRRSYIGNSTRIARKYFWRECDAFSMSFGALTTADGVRFRQECKSAGKNLMVWTVNQPDHMMEAVRWEVNAIITDVTKTWLDLRSALQVDYDKTGAQYGRGFLWTTLRFYTPFLILRSRVTLKDLENKAGPFDDHAPSSEEAVPVVVEAVAAALVETKA